MSSPILVLLIGERHKKKRSTSGDGYIWSGGITSGNRKLAQGRDLSINSGRNLKGIRKLSPHLGGELSGSGSIGGKLCTIQK